MSQSTSSSKFFGMDVAQLWQDVGVAWHLMQDWRVLRWLSPALPTQVALPDGKTTGIVEQPGATGAEHRVHDAARFFGVLVPQEMVLWHHMRLPELPPNEEFLAVELEARSLSPFADHDLVWSYFPARDEAGGRITQIALASRKIVRRLLDSKEQVGRASVNLEAWVKSPVGHDYLLLPGFGESKRRTFTARWRQANWGLAILLVVTLAAIATTPTAQLRLRALEAAAKYANIQAIANPALQKREQQMQFDRQGQALTVLMDKALEPEALLLRLTQIVPDDTYLTNVRAQAGKVTIAGLTPNTASFMQHLGGQIGVKEVKSPVPSTKQRGADREYFTIEFVLEKSALTATK